MAKRSAVQTVITTLQASPGTSVNPLFSQITDCFGTSARTVPSEVQSLARAFLRRSGEVIVSSSMTLRTAITALRAHGDYNDSSPELTLLEAVFRVSEDRQVPPKILMNALASGEPEHARWAMPAKKTD